LLPKTPKPQGTTIFQFFESEISKSLILVICSLLMF